MKNIFISFTVFVMLGLLVGFSHLPKVSNVATRPIDGTSFQPSTTRDCEVRYTVQIVCTVGIGGGQQGNLILETSPDNSVWTEVSRLVNGNTSTVTVGISLVQTVGVELTAFVPRGYYVRMRQSNTTGTPVYSYISGRETLQ